MDSQIPTTKIFNFDVYEFNFKKKLDSDDFFTFNNTEKNKLYLKKIKILNYTFNNTDMSSQ
jgi:hypothetical protein